MSTPTVLGNNAQLFYNATVPPSGSYTQIVNVKEISTPEPEWAAVNMSSLTDSCDVKAVGFVDNKQFSFTVYHTSANKTLLDTTLPGNMMTYKIEFSDSTGWSMAGFLKSWKAKADRNGAVTYDCTVEISGCLTPTTS
jgi:hypothetical protein